MPELPEVESFARQLNAVYANKVLREMRFFRLGLRYPFPQKELRAVFSRGAVWQCAKRCGKQLFMQTNYGLARISLGMTGRFSGGLDSDPVAQHEHLRLVFEDASTLCYLDPRRFGFWLTHPQHDLEHACDPLQQQDLEELFTSEAFLSQKRALKLALLDQKLIGGLGNIYVVEALFAARLSPLLPAGALSPAQGRVLARVIPAILHEAIARGGSSIATYRQLHGQQGGFQDLHKVYGREGQSCLRPRCTGTIVRMVQAGRGTWYCSRCQNV